jgi:hypothetical protein
MLLSKGVDSVPREAINEWEYVIRTREAKEAMPREVAQTWLDLMRRGCLPAWAVAQMKLDMVEKAAL